MNDSFPGSTLFTSYFLFKNWE